MSNYTHSEVLAHHGIKVLDPTEDNLTDAAREKGLIFACLECGSVAGINVDAPLGDYPSVEAARAGTRDSLDLDTLCCDGVQYVY